MDLKGLSEEQLRDIAKVVKEMATTGHGTDFCIEEGALPVPIHFYYSIPDIKDLEARKVWERPSPLHGIDMRPEYQIETLTSYAEKYGKECNWPEHQPEAPHGFHWNNQSFGFQCASLLHYFIREYKPKNIIEVGSGMSP